MKRVYIPLTLFLFLIMEGVALDFLPEKMLTKYSIVPHWVFMFLLLVAVFYDKRETYYSIIYGVLFGLLIDIVYTGLLGVYMFAYVIVIYIIFELRNFVYTNFLVTMIIGLISIAFVDLFINGIYSLIGVADIEWAHYFIYRLTPTVIANLLFLIVLYPIMSKRLNIWGNEQLSDAKTL